MAQPKPNVPPIDRDLIAEAKALGAYAPFCNEAQLRERIGRIKRAFAQAEEAPEAIEGYNEYIRINGVFGTRYCGAGA